MDPPANFSGSYYNLYYNKISHACFLTSAMPSPFTLLICNNVVFYYTARLFNIYYSWASKFSNFYKSVFVITITNGLLLNRGLILLNNDIYSSILRPQVQDISIKYKIQAFKCAKAVTAYISIVFLCSNAWSKIPGVSITYHLT